MPYGIFTYRVTSVEIVDPSDREVIATTDPDVASLTLTTCHPEYSASQRLIIHADLDLEASPPPGLPVINYGRDTPIPTDVGLPGEDVDDPTTTLAPTTTSASPTSTIVGQTTGPSTSAVATSLAPTTVVAPSTTTDPLYTVNPGGGATGGPTDVLDNSEEAFSNRWFSDEEAFPQVTLWAGSCAAIVMAAYLLAKRFRNLLIGLAIGVLPFVVGLYFFYENVNRLLPAALVGPRNRRGPAIRCLRSRMAGPRFVHLVDECGRSVPASLRSHTAQPRVRDNAFWRARALRVAWHPSAEGAPTVHRPIRLRPSIGWRAVVHRSWYRPGNGSRAGIVAEQIPARLPLESHPALAIRSPPRCRRDEFISARHRTAAADFW